jgi:chlorobactene glucosyltransferase
MTGALGGANGQFMFFTRDAYNRIGGHAAVKSHVVEDVALGREVASRMGEGMRLINCDSVQFSTVRMYRSFGESWAGFSKNLRAVFDRERAIFWLFFLSLLFVWFFPSVAWLDCRFGEIALWNGALVWAIRWLVTFRLRLAISSALLHPISVLVFIGIALDSWRLSHGKGVTWKGRVYRPEV